MGNERTNKDDLVISVSDSNDDVVVYNVWNNLFAKDDETIRKEQEREARRIEREEFIKNMK